MRPVRLPLQALRRCAQALRALTRASGLFLLAPCLPVEQLKASHPRGEQPKRRPPKSVLVPDPSATESEAFVGSLLRKVALVVPAGH